MTRRLILPGLGTVLLGFALWSVLNGAPVRAPAEPPAPPPRTPFAASIAAIGQVEPASEVIAIAVDRPGLVVRVDVVSGQNVPAGAALFATDDRAERAAVAEAEARLGRQRATVAVRRAELLQAEANLVGLEAVAERARLDSDRYARLVADGVAASRQRAETALAGGREAQANRNAARAGIAAAGQQIEAEEAAAREAEAALERARVDLAKTVTRAPIAGQVLRVSVRPGEYAPAGVLATPLIQMGAVDPLHVRAEIDEVDGPKLRTGTAAVAIPRGDSGTRVPLTWVRIEPSVVPKRSLSGAGGERVDTRVVQVVFGATATAPLRVGQLVDVFIERKVD